MGEIKLKLNERGQGAFYFIEGDERLGEMIVTVAGNDMIVHHTEVEAKAEGKGIAKQLLSAMAEHARKNNFKVTPLCPYVHAQFKRHADAYADIWKR